MISHSTPLRASKQCLAPKTATSFDTPSHESFNYYSPEKISTKSKDFAEQLLIDESAPLMPISLDRREDTRKPMFPAPRSQRNRVCLGCFDVKENFSREASLKTPPQRDAATINYVCASKLEYHRTISFLRQRKNPVCEPMPANNVLPQYQRNAQSPLQDTKKIESEVGSKDIFSRDCHDLTYIPNCLPCSTDFLDSSCLLLPLLESPQIPDGPLTLSRRISSRKSRK